MLSRVGVILPVSVILWKWGAPWLKIGLWITLVVVSSRWPILWWVLKNVLSLFLKLWSVIIVTLIIWPVFLEPKDNHV